MTGCAAETRDRDECRLRPSTAKVRIEPSAAVQSCKMLHLESNDRFEDAAMRR